MRDLLIAYGRDLVLLVLLVALVASRWRRDRAARLIERTREIESRNERNDVGALGRRIARDVENQRSTCEKWRDAIAVAAVLAAIVGDHARGLALLLQ